MKNENEKWHQLLTTSAPTFAGETITPYGFVTSTLSRMKAEQGQVAEIERIGWRALLASLAALAIAATVAVTLDLKSQSTDFEPGVRGLIQMENVSVS
jgi:hypothetical protein